MNGYPETHQVTRCLAMTDIGQVRQRVLFAIANGRRSDHLTMEDCREGIRVICRFDCDKGFATGAAEGVNLPRDEHVTLWIQHLADPRRKNRQMRCSFGISGLEAGFFKHWSNRPVRVQVLVVTRR